MSVAYEFLMDWKYLGMREKNMREKKCIVEIKAQLSFNKVTPLPSRPRVLDIRKTAAFTGVDGFASDSHFFPVIRVRWRQRTWENTSAQISKGRKLLTFPASEQSSRRFTWALFGILQCVLEISKIWRNRQNLSHFVNKSGIFPKKYSWETTRSYKKKKGKNEVLSPLFIFFFLVGLVPLVNCLLKVRLVLCIYDSIQWIQWILSLRKWRQRFTIRGEKHW